MPDNTSLILQILLIILRELRDSQQDLDEQEKRTFEEIKEEVSKWA